jgi:hypothetical protein
VKPADYDLIGLAMQEPQYRSSGARELLDVAAMSKVPCMSIMNMPPLPYMRRIACACGFDYAQEAQKRPPGCLLRRCNQVGIASELAFRERSGTCRRWLWSLRNATAWFGG